MKHIMNFLRRWKIELISDMGERLSHFEGSIMFRA
jgi:hypothetical protein